MSAARDPARAFPTPTRAPRAGADGLLDLRQHPAQVAPPAPLAAGDAAVYHAARAAGATHRAAFEALLRALPAARADALTQRLKESRGAWFPLLRGEPGAALVVGSSLSGAVVVLAAFGYAVTLLDPAPERLRLAHACHARQVGARVRGYVGGDGPELPFVDASFDLVVVEEGLGAADAGRAPTLGECARVARGELVVLGDNRLGYKRSSGRYQDLRAARPLEWARRALRPRDGERTLAGYRRALARPGFAPPRAFATYAHRLEFANVVALDAPRPALPIGPSERRNRLKTAAHRAGLFPWLTPSYLFVACRAALDGRATRGARLLEALAEAVGEPRPELDELAGTRGNTAVLQTARPGAPAVDPAGRWTVHVALYLEHRGALQLHLELLRRVRRDAPEVPVPEALFHGTLDGVELTCERRLAGFASHHLVGDPARADRVLEQVAAHFAALVVRPAAPFAEADFDARIAPRFELLLRQLDDAGTRRTLEALRARARAELVGRALPRTLRHGDLRAKHVQVDADGRVLGYLDWGTAGLEELPGHDLLHLFVHDRKQQQGLTDGEAWRLALEDRDLRPGERRAFELHRERLGLSRDDARALAELYPVEVGHTAESNWPYTRPGWFRRHFGL